MFMDTFVIMILMGNSRFPSPNMNVLFIKVILSYNSRCTHEDIHIKYRNFHKLNTWALVFMYFNNKDINPNQTECEHQ